MLGGRKHSRRRAWAALAILPAAALLSRPAAAIVLHADPNDLTSKLPALRAGDTLILKAGQYRYPGTRQLVNMHGRDGAWITITGPEPPLEAVMQGPAGRNTLELVGCSYLILRRLKFDGRNIADDAIKAADPVRATAADQRRPVHHIRIEECTIVNHDRHQTYVGINCQVPAWNWTIRRNRILSAGTGIYLGDSKGRFPFLNATIEYNLVRNPKGYCLQIKHYDRRIDPSDMPTRQPYESMPGRDEVCQNVIRHNVFAKNDREGEMGDRPNVLLDGFPDAGPGARDRHRVYGNLVLNNPREALLQGSGRLSIHDNIFISSARPAVCLQAHEGKVPRSALVYHNTIITDREPVRVSGATPGAQIAVAGNIMASGKIRDDAAVRLGSNLVMGLWRAESFFESVSSRIAEMDLRPVRMPEIKIPMKTRATLEQDRLLGQGQPLGTDFVGRKRPGWNTCGALGRAYPKPVGLLRYAGAGAIDHSKLDAAGKPPEAKDSP